MPTKRIFIDHHWVSELDFNVEVSFADLFFALNVTCLCTLLGFGLFWCCSRCNTVGVAYELEAKLTMMKTSILALLVAGASAFAPASMVR